MFAYSLAWWWLFAFITAQISLMYDCAVRRKMDWEQNTFLDDATHTPTSLPVTCFATAPDAAPATIAVVLLLRSQCWRMGVNRVNSTSRAGHIQATKNNGGIIFVMKLNICRLLSAWANDMAVHINYSVERFSQTITTILPVYFVAAFSICFGTFYIEMFGK